MSTQFISIDTALCVRFAGPQAEGPTSVGAPSDRDRLGDSDFFKGKSIAELAREQGVGPIKDIRVFAGVIPDDDDVDEMLAEIYRLREP
jgi:hypothetical protein